MDMQDRWRLIDSDLVPPAESAALDEAILEAHIASAVPNTLHFYRRKVPTVSVGYFQKVSNSVHPEECLRRGVSIVRRKSGGSSIFTDRGQLIYGLVVRSSDVPASPEDTFRVLCTALAKAISRFGVAASYRPLNDVEVSGRKISGSAQLRRRGSVLQHGTVLVDTDLETMDAVLKVDRAKNPDMLRPSQRIVTLANLLPSPPEMGDVKSKIEAELERALSVKFHQEELTSSERVAVENLVRERYSKDEWNFRF
jgi:lipoate-protein ligase A